jgi:hypothetical protein
VPRCDGRGGIRTLDTLAGMPVFETGSFNHSDTRPGMISEAIRLGIV